MRPRSHVSGRRRGPTAIALATGIAAMLALPTGASAGSAFFRAQGCDPTYRAESISTYSTAKTPSYRKALDRWSFDDVGGRKIKPRVNWNRASSASELSKLHQMKYLDRLFGIADERKLDSTPPFPKGDRRVALEHAVAIAADWSRAANRGNVPAKEAWKQRVAAIRAPFLAYAARRGACAGALSDGDAKQIERALRRHVRVLKQRPPENVPQNHKLSTYAGAAMLGSYFPKDRELRSVADKAGKRFIASIRGGYQGTEGVWLEHSPRYHRLAYDLLNDWVRRIDPGAGAVRRARDRLLASLGHLVMPDNRLVTFGDTSGEVIEDGAILGARRPGWWVAPRSGYATYGDASHWFGMTSQYHQRQHKQADELTFDLFERGEHLIQDTGFLHKDRDRWWEYQESSAAHSTLTVDGRDFDWKLHQNPYGSGVRAWGAGDGWYAVRATNPLLIAPRKLTAKQRTHSNNFQRALRQKLRRARRYDAHHTRTYLYKPGEALIVADAVRADRPHTYRRHFQFGPEISATKLGPNVNFGAGRLQGRLVNDSLQPGASLSLSGAGLSPLQGFVFAAAGRRAERKTATWTTQTQNLDQASGFFYGPSDVSTIKIKRPLADTVQIELRGLLASPIGMLTVTRSGSTLTVDET